MAGAIDKEDILEAAIAAIWQVMGPRIAINHKITITTTSFREQNSI